MKNSFFTDFSLAFKAEHIKTKGTWTYILSMLVGGMIPFVSLLLMTFNPPAYDEHFPYIYYHDYYAKVIRVVIPYFLPLLIILMASRLTQLDHRNGGWQLMETQPLRKSALYFSKFAVLTISVILCLASMYVFTLLAGYLHSQINPMPPVALMHIPWIEMAHLTLRFLIASLALAAIQYGISVIVPSFIWSLLIGFSGLMWGIVLNYSGYFWPWYPFHQLLAASNSLDGSDLGYFMVYTEWLSVCIGIFFLYLGYQWYVLKYDLRAFGRPKILLPLLLVLILMGIPTLYLLTPKELPTHGRTVLAGEIEGEEHFTHGMIVAPAYSDTLVQFDIKDNKFHAEMDGTVPYGRYWVIINESFAYEVVLHTADSVYLRGLAYNGNLRWKKTKGSLLVENAFTQSEWDHHLNIINWYISGSEYLAKPLVLADEIEKAWKKSQREVRNYRSIDNIAIRDDFKRHESDLITYQYLRMWDVFLHKHQGEYPDLPQPSAPEIMTLQAQVKQYDETYLKDKVYIDFLKQRFILNDKRDVSYQQRILDGTLALPHDAFRDKLNYLLVKEAMDQASDTTELHYLMGTYGQNIADTVLDSKLRKHYQLLYRLSEGQPFPSFDLRNAQDSTQHIDQYRGKLVAIDVWATWCGPCKVEDPFFEKLAHKHKDQPIAFIALSIDRDLDAWRKDVQTRSKIVDHWYVKDVQSFMRNLNIPSIPRYILIDKEGRFVNNQMPNPSDRNFEALMMNALKKYEQYE
jgi:thiol-disulfide isomerase/thioredoxin